MIVNLNPFISCIFKLPNNFIGKGPAIGLPLALTQFPARVHRRCQIVFPCGTRHRWCQMTDDTVSVLCRDHHHLGITQQTLFTLQKSFPCTHVCLVQLGTKLKIKSRNITAADSLLSGLGLQTLPYICSWFLIFNNHKTNTTIQN